MNDRCKYPDCDCDVECRMTGLRLDDDEPPARRPTVGDRVRDVLAPGLGVVALLWRKLTGSGRR